MCPCTQHNTVWGLCRFPAHRMQECVKAVAAFGFVKSPYPVILTLENHTDNENQVRLDAFVFVRRRRVLGGRNIP